MNSVINEDTESLEDFIKRKSNEIFSMRVYHQETSEPIKGDDDISEDLMKHYMKLLDDINK